MKVAGETTFDGLHELGTTAAVVGSPRWALGSVFYNHACEKSSNWNHNAGEDLVVLGSDPREGGCTRLCMHKASMDESMPPSVLASIADCTTDWQQWFTSTA